jgi:hypothetical protein
VEKKERIPDFEGLLDEIEEIISELNKQGAQLFGERKYHEARSLLEKVESITILQNKIRVIAQDWRDLKIPEVKPSQEKIKAAKRRSTKRLKQGLRTQEEDFKIPLLKTLVDMGGKGRVAVVLDNMEALVTPMLTEYDLEPLKSKNTIRWRNTVMWARNEMVKEGLLSSKSAYGVWEITNEGRKWLTEQENGKQKDDKNRDPYIPF